jgi:hypothetical protein
MQKNSSPRRRLYLYFALLGFVLASAFLVRAIFQSTSSTAAVGFLFLPVFGGIGAVLGGICAFLFFTFKDFFTNREETSPARVFLALALVLLGAGTLVLWGQESAALELAKNQSAGAEELRLVSERRFFLRKDAVEEALAANPSTPLPVLEKFVRGPAPRLWNTVGANPGISVELLTEIVSGPLSYDKVAGAAGNPKLTQASIARLAGVGPENFPGKVEYELYQTFVLAALARRPDLPQEILDRLARWEAPEYFLVVALISSPRISCSQLERFLGNESQVLAGMVERELKKRDCKSPGEPDQGK